MLLVQWDVLHFKLVLLLHQVVFLYRIMENPGMQMKLTNELF